jgi:MFS family permease
MMLSRFGAPRWLSFTVVIWGLVAMAFSATNSKIMFLSLRVALGLAECGTFPGIWTHLSHFYTARELGSAYAQVTTSTALAQVIGAPIAAVILSSFDNFLGLAGWQWLFLIEGLTTLVFGVLLRIFLAPSPREAACLTTTEQEWLQRRQDALPTASKDTSFNAQMMAVVRVLQNWRVFYMSAIWMTITQSMYGIIFFAPMMIHQIFTTTAERAATSAAIGTSSPASSPAELPSYGCSESGGSGEHSNTGAGVALLSMVPFAAAAGAMLINAKLFEAANERHYHAGIPILLGSFFMALAPIALQYIAPIAAFFSLVGAAAFVWAFHAPFMSWPAVFLRGHEASTGFAVINSIGSIGGFIGPFLLGVLADKGNGSYDLAMFVLAGMLALGGVGIIFFPDGGGEGGGGSLSGLVGISSSSYFNEDDDNGSGEGDRLVVGNDGKDSVEPILPTTRERS